jgi:hypothetical protein
MKHFLISISLLLLFSACHKKEENTEPTEGRRTVIVYISGDNTLSSYSSGDLQELITGSYDKLSSSDRLVAFVDRISNTEKPFILQIKGDRQHPADTLFKYSEDFYASDTQNFTEVLKRITQLCPAKEYGLILWGHGSGWNIEADTRITSAPRRAYGIDNGNNYSHGNYGLWLNIPDMRSAFEQLGIKWKFIFADCCNMMCIEMAYELRNWADYLIGSPAEIPGSGAPYNKIVPYFFSQSEDIYEGIIDEYAKANPNYLPLSAICMSEMESLATATKAAIPAIAAHLQQGDTQATNGIIYYFSPQGRYNNVNKSMYDMNDMIRTALDEQPDAYEIWHEVFKKAVPKHVISSMWETMSTNTVNFNDFTVTDAKMGCVSMFFPLDKYERVSCLYKYNTDIKKMQWYDAVGWSTVGY